jgi:choline dehydrogenase-like flavoprotein
MSGGYSVILIGSGFASAFFLHEYLEHAGADARVLVLERGADVTFAQLSADRDRLLREGQASFRNLHPEKPWQFSVGFGGSSNCWGATSPRLLPEDFRMRSTYGVGQDWPIGYDDLEPYYTKAEEILAVAGPADSPYPRSKPYPQPPHRFSTVDKLFKKAFPDRFFHQPSARPTRATTRRPACCGNGVCRHCPINSKFTISNELRHLFEDPRVRLETRAEVLRVRLRGDVATGVEYVQDGKTLSADGDVVALGANAIHNPFLLLQSGLDHPALGRNLHEQSSAFVVVHLRDLDNLPGSSQVVGFGYMLYQGEHRRTRAAALMDSWSTSVLRDERGKWLRIARLGFVFEDLPQADNCVVVNPEKPAQPEVRFEAGRSAYCTAGIEALESQLDRVLAPLPVESVKVRKDFSRTESHILGTTVMGRDPAASVVDADLVHHRVRNLVVLGSGTFPTSSPSHPTLTLCALSLRSARRMFSRGTVS